MLGLVWAVLLAAFILVPALPRTFSGAFGERIGGLLRVVSISQSWAMYAPDPKRGEGFASLSAVMEDGTVVALEEAEIADSAWGTTSLLKKSRRDLWRQHAAMNPKGPNRNRSWFLRGVCVREGVRRGVLPKAIVMERVFRSFRSPERVRLGDAPLGPEQRSLISSQPCELEVVRSMMARAIAAGGSR